MKNQSRMKSYEELRYQDDFMFGKVMEDKELCREVLECLMQRPVGELTEVQTQKEYRYTSDGKPIRLDVYNEDDAGVVYDAEMENLNHKSIEEHELPKRSRFYQGSIERAESELTVKIENSVVKARKNKVWRTQYMKEWTVLQDAKDEGIEIGREEGREEGILAFIQEKMDDDIEADIILQKLQKYYRVSPEEAEKYLLQAKG